MNNKSFEHYRYELKFRLSRRMLEVLYNWMISSNYGFKTSYPDRVINNIYYDSRDFKAYHDNEDGISNRTKLRVRWYGDFNNVQNPVLELKNKRNSLGYKNTYKVQKFNPETLPKIKDIIIDCDDKLNFHVYKYNMPCLINNYKRSYFATRDNIRLTIDTNIGYKKPNVPAKFLRCEFHAILEIKYNSLDQNVAEKMLGNLPFALEKNSKYVNGVQKLWV